MTIATTVGALLTAEEPLGRLLVKPLAIKAAYHLKRLAKLVAAELATFHELRESTIKALGVQREPTAEEAARGVQGPLYEVTPLSPHWSDFQQRMMDLLAQPVAIPLEPLDVSLLDGERISARDLQSLEPLLREGP